MPAEQFQLTLTHEGISHVFSVEVLKKGLHFHFLVTCVSPEEKAKLPAVHVRPGRSGDEHWHFTCHRKDKATDYYPAGLLEGIGEALDRYNLTSFI